MDRRQKKTRDAIFKAFIQLVSKKNYNSITVQEIIDCADVGRTTFYAHFETKEILLEELCKELFDHIIGTAMGHKDVSGRYSDCKADESVYLHLIHHLKQNDSNILALLSCENNELFLKYFKNELQKLVSLQFDDNNLSHKTNIPRDFLINHISSTFVETISWWLLHDMKESPEEINRYFLSAIEPIV